MKKLLMTLAIVALSLAATLAPASAQPGNGNGPPSGTPGSPVINATLFLDGEIVRTVVPPAAAPQEGVDDYFVPTNGVEGQLGIAAAGPGDPGYHGGRWAFLEVTWNDTNDAVLLTSATQVRELEAAGLLTVTRQAHLDFKCPIQPISP